MNDLRFALRMLLKSPGFTLAAVLTLALGIGLNTAVFSLANPILFRPLPVRDPARLVFLQEMSSGGGTAGHNVPYPDYLDWRAQNQVFEDVGAYQIGSATATGRGDPERVRAATISATLFSMLGVPPWLGRSFREGEDLPGAKPVVLLDYGYWQGRFGGDKNVIAQDLNLNGNSYAIVGVMPPGFRFPEQVEVWVPLVVEAPEKRRGACSYECVARLRPGATLEQAWADLIRISRIIEAEHPATNTGVSAVIRPLREQSLQEYVLMSWVLLGAVAFVLAVACANVANLSLSRALGRQREWAIRLSLGSSRWRLIRLLLAESLLLAIAGGVLGLAFSRWGVALAQALLPEVPYWLDFSLDCRVLLFTLGAVLVSCLVSGLAPAWQVSRIAPVENLRSGSPGAGDKPRHLRLRGTLVVTEVALALLLVGGSLLMGRTLWNLQQADPGFNPREVLIFSVDLWQDRFADNGRRIRFFRELRQRLAGLPGVRNAAAAVNLPMVGANWSQAFYIEGRPELPPSQMPQANMRIVTPAYFRTMEIPLLRGRDFDETDQTASRSVVIVDESFAQAYFPNGSPIGQRLRLSVPNMRDTWWEIVGVTGEVKHYGIDARVLPGLYFPFTQFPSSSMVMVLKAEKSSAPGLLAAARHEVRQLDSEVVVGSPRLMQDVVSRSFWGRRFICRLFTAFAGLALVLASVGIVGVVSYAVSQRTHEIGVRLALGATKSEVIRLLLKEGFQLSLGGIGLGLLASWGLLRVLQSELYGVSATDPLHYVLLALGLGIVALTACYVPARRAAKVDPIVALRYE